MTDDDVRRLRVEVRVAYAGVRFRQSRYRDCIRWCQEAVERAPSLDQPRELAHASYLLDHALSFLGQKTDDAFALQALEIFEELGDRVMAANVLNNLGVEAYNRGQWDDAADYQRRHADARRKAGDVMGSAIAAYNAGLILIDQQRDDEAEAEFARVRSVAAAAGHAIAENAALACLGTISARRGDRRAIDRLDRAIAAFREIGAAYFTFDALLRKSEAFLLLDEPERAVDLAAEVLDEAAGQDGLEASVVGLHRVRGTALLRLGRTERASGELSEALGRARSEELPLEELLILEVMGEDMDRQSELRNRLGIRAASSTVPGSR